jgi:hypothetical protein
MAEHKYTKNKRLRNIQFANRGLRGKITGILVLVPRWRNEISLEFRRQIPSLQETGCNADTAAQIKLTEL